MKERTHKTRDEALIYEAKVLARLQIKRSALAKELREINRQIRVTKKNLRSLISERGWIETGAKSKVLGGE